MTDDEFDKEFQKVLDSTAKYWDSDLFQNLLDEHSHNGKIDIANLSAVLRESNAQYANVLVYNALHHFLVNDRKG